MRVSDTRLKFQTEPWTGRHIYLGNSARRVSSVRNIFEQTRGHARTGEIRKSLEPHSMSPRPFRLANLTRHFPRRLLRAKIAGEEISLPFDSDSQFEDFPERSRRGRHRRGSGISKKQRLSARAKERAKPTESQPSVIKDEKRRGYTRFQALFRGNKSRFT